MPCPAARERVRPVERSDPAVGREGALTTALPAGGLDSQGLLPERAQGGLGGGRVRLEQRRRRSARPCARRAADRPQPRRQRERRLVWPGLGGDERCACLRLEHHQRAAPVGPPQRLGHRRVGGRARQEQRHPVAGQRLGEQRQRGAVAVVEIARLAVILDPELAGGGEKAAGSHQGRYGDRHAALAHDGHEEVLSVGEGLGAREHPANLPDGGRQRRAEAVPERGQLGELLNRRHHLEVTHCGSPPAVHRLCVDAQHAGDHPARPRTRGVSWPGRRRPWLGARSSCSRR